MARILVDAQAVLMPQRVQRLPSKKEVEQLDTHTFKHERLGLASVDMAGDIVRVELMSASVRAADLVAEDEIGFIYWKLPGKEFENNNVLYFWGLAGSPFLTKEEAEDYVMYHPEAYL